jgi:hypothetical protein
MNGFNKFLNKIKNEIINLIEINYKKNYFNKHFFFFKKIFFLFKNLFIKFNWIQFMFIILYKFRQNYKMYEFYLTFKNKKKI